jgi:hypothetical protein
MQCCAEATDTKFILYQYIYWHASSWGSMCPLPPNPYPRFLIPTLQPARPQRTTCLFPLLFAAAAAAAAADIKPARMKTQSSLYVRCENLYMMRSQLRPCYIGHMHGQAIKAPPACLRSKSDSCRGWQTGDRHERC